MLRLVIGNKNYSSWSLRPWIALRKLDIDFEETRISLFVEGFQDEILNYAPVAKVPILIDEEVVVWESSAILEYLAEQYPSLLPSTSKQRAYARSLVAEMHAGFHAIRNLMPMNCRATHRHIILTDELKVELERIQTIITECREHHAEEGKWLLGHFTVVDAMYIPMMLRLHTYDIECLPWVEEYKKMVLNDADIQAWYAASEEEQEVIPADEVGETISSDS